jgi:nitric oxide reductase activation protein
MLGKRLQVRNESRETVFNRQKVGRLDKRMVSSLGFGNEAVFFTREVDQYKKANLHISIDASSSMGGTKWEQTMTNVVALTKAVDMIPNLNIQVSFRTTTRSSPELPYVVIAYDSRKDTFSKVKSLFKYLTPTGTTPEGLCFEALMKEMVSSDTSQDSYFMNISDGEPCFGSYSGDVAATHTKKQVDKIQSMGIKVLSYFVSGDRYSYGNYVKPEGYTSRIFNLSYGKTAAYIDVTNMMEVSKTMNRLFLSKD